MSDTSTQEPSMEEILSSIRRIISSDDDDGEAAEAQADETPAEEPAEEASAETDQPDVDALSETSAVEPAPDDDVDQTAADALAESPTPAPDPAPAPEPESAPVPEDDVLELTNVVNQPQSATAANEQLVSPPTAAASVASLSSLHAAAGGRTVEQLAADLMRPMLRQWLDTHLPELVERLVQAEIKRLAEDARR